MVCCKNWICFKDKRDDGQDMEKVVVVSQWTSMLLIVKKHLQKLKLKFSEINGGVPAGKRGDIVNDFNRKNCGAQVLANNRHPFPKIKFPLKF